MRRPWWMPRAGWRGFKTSFRASFQAAYHGANREMALHAGLLAVYRELRNENPTLTWAEFWAACQAGRQPQTFQKDGETHE